MIKKQPAVYILASKCNGTLYTGVTADLLGRVWEHKNDAIEGFTKKYSVHRLVYFEQHETMPSAIEREKQIKKWKRKWKQELIEEQNPTWKDSPCCHPPYKLDPRLRMSGTDPGVLFFAVVAASSYAA